MTDEKSNRVKGRLKLSNTKLNIILEITKAINNNASRTTLFGILKSILIQELNIGRFALFTYEGHWRLSLEEGISKEQIAEINIYSIVNQYATIDVIHSSTEIGTNDFDIVVPVFHKDQPFAYLLLADLNGEKIEISPIIRHLKFIQTLANIIVVALENKRLYKEEMKQIAIKKELEMAQSMQSLLFPNQLPNEKNIEAQAYYLPHSEVGGDYYDLVPLNDGKVALCIADVSGKGMSAAILMANFQANLRAQLATTDDLVQLIKMTNKKVIESVHYEKFITLFIAIFDPKKKELHYLNAGHQPGLLLQNGEITQLKKGCTILGMFDELPEIESELIKLSPNAKLVCFTDGLTELETEEGEQLEIEGILPLISKGKSIREMKNTLEQKIEELELNKGLQDDVTLLLAEFLR